MMQLIRQWNVPGAFKGVIICYYDPVTQTFEVDYVGWLVSHDTTLTEEELLVPNNTEITTICHNFNKHTLRAIVNFPFLAVTVELNSVDCGYPTPPPVPDPVVDPPPTSTSNYICYQVRFKNVEDQIVEANIFDQTTYAEGRNIEVRPLRPSGEPVRLECIDNDEDKFTPIRAKQCIIEFLSTNQNNLNTFAAGQDNRWYVEVLVSGSVKFKGFLVMNDMQEDFLSPPNIVSLTATDNLGLLKDIPLTNFDGESPIVVRPKTPYGWLTYLAWALSKTSLSLPINIQHNLREEHNTGDPFWENVLLDAKTFEDEIGTCINCYEVIERLLGEECFITQYNGEWWVIRVDELDSRTRYVYNVSADLTTVTPSEPTLNKTIKKDQDINWIERSAYVQVDRPHSNIKEQYNYQYPKEIIDNIDFARGGQILIVVTPPDEKHYHLEDWTEKRNFPASGTALISAYIKRIFNDFDTEIERYVVIPGVNTGSNTEYIESNAVPILEKDKFTFSVDFKFDTNKSGSGIVTDLLAYVYIQSGITIYSLDIDGVWHLGHGFTIAYQWDRATVDESEWQTISVEADAAPIEGDVYVCLLKSSQYGNSENTNFSNLRFEYFPYINGSYQKYNGHYWKVSQSGEYKAARDEEVFVTDSPRPLFKGAMLYFDFPSDQHRLTDRWYDYSLNQTAPSTDDMKPYGWFQAQSVWNQYRREMRIFDGEMYGLTDDDLPDLVHKYTLGDPSPHTQLRTFMCLHYSQSLKKCTWTAYFVEVFKSDQEKVYTDDTEFKFIESR